MKDLQDITKALKLFNLNTVEVSNIIEELKEIGKLPICTMKIQKGRSIYRARFHSDPDLLFDSSDQLSYRKDLENITSFGRANFPHESRFYGALSSGKIDAGYIISVFETSRNLRNNLDGIERVTFSQWTVKSDLDVVVLGSNASKVEKAFEELHKYIDAYYASQPDSEKIIELFDFIGDEYSKRVPSNHDHEYKLSSAFAHVIMSVGGLGLVYPSVQTKHSGFNIVLKNEIAQDFLEIDKVCVADLHKRGNNVVLSQIKYCMAEGKELNEYKNLGHPYELTPDELEQQLSA